MGEQFRMGKGCKQSLPAATREPADRTGLTRKFRTELRLHIGYHGFR